MSRKKGKEIGMWGWARISGQLDNVTANIVEYEVAIKAYKKVKPTTPEEVRVLDLADAITQTIDIIADHATLKRVVDG